MTHETFISVGLKQEATLSVDADSMPRDASYLIIDGCRDVVLAGGAVSQMEKLQRVDVVDVGRILFRKDAFNQAQVPVSTSSLLEFVSF